MKKIISVLLSAMLFAFTLPLLSLAEEAPLSLTFADSKSIDINSPVSATLVAPEGMEKAEFYIENTLVYTLLGDGSSFYDIELDLSNAPVLGNTNIVAKAYAYEIFEISVPVNLVRLKAEANVFSENFNTFTSGTWPSTVHGYIETANGTPLNEMGPYVHTEGDTALKVTFPAVYNKSSTYMEKDNLAVSKNNILKIKFDAYFSSEKENMRVELRDSNGGYPQYNGAGMGSIPLFASGGKLCDGENTYAPATWYSVLIEIDLSTPVGATGQGAWIYIKGGEYDDYTLINYMPGFSCDGFKKIRFTCLSAGGNNEYILIDNFEILKQEFMQKWYFTAEYEDENGEETAFDSVKTNGAKAILKFSEDMGENISGKVKLENEMGDSVDFSGSYNADEKTYTISINDTLLNGGKYIIKVLEGVLSAAGNEANSTLGTAFYAEEYPVRVKSLSYEYGTATVEIDNIHLVEENMALVLTTYSGDKCIDSNIVLLNGDSETYTVSIAKESDHTICAYIIDSLSTLKLLNVYSK